MSGRLTEGFRAISELRWTDFVELEQSPDATNFDAIITSMARSAMKGNLRAIQSALDRLDGKVAAEIEVEYPKFYVRYPRATRTADDPKIIDEVSEVDTKLLDNIVQPVVEQNGGKISIGHTPKVDNDVFPALADTEEELPTGSLRSVLDKMIDAPKTIVTNILASAEAVDGGDISRGNPLVKSVIVAGLMKLVHDGRISAVFEVFDQIDGKVADKIKMLGDDVYLTRFDTIAPAGAVKNADGVYEVVAENVTSAWTARLEEKNARSRR